MADLGIKSAIKSILPKGALSAYHYSLALLANAIYGFPSRRLIVVGVTGTQGKTTTAHMISHLLNELGQPCGLISTALIKIGKREWLNDLKMTMPGRFKLQSYLRKMIGVGCKFAVIETSSEGIAQWRHIGISYDAAVFTNLSPEHIEAHGSYDNYRNAKLKLWKKIMAGKPKVIGGKTVSRLSVINADDKEADLFLRLPADKKIAFSVHGQKNSAAEVNLLAEKVSADAFKSAFLINGVEFNLSVGGEFTVYNALAAVSVLTGWGFNLKLIAKVASSFTGTPGRLEFIKAGQNFSAVVDYAHTPESLEAVYRAISSQKNNKKIIAVLGSCGGGRDQAKRPVLGKLAGQFAGEVIVTNEDPYDEDPLSIMKAVAEGAASAGKVMAKNLFIIEDRRQAIARAAKQAQANDLVIITGKGCEQWLMTSKGKIPWDDRRVVEEEIRKILH